MRKVTGVLTILFGIGWLAVGQRVTGLLWLAIGLAWLIASFVKRRKDEPVDGKRLARRFSRLTMFWS